MSKLMKSLDLYDKKILYELDIDSRMSFSALSKKVHLPKETVNYRFKRLIEEGYIRKTYTSINGSLLGFKYYMVFFKFTNMDQENEDKIIKYLKGNQSCFELQLMDGNFDLIFITMQRDALSLHKFLNDFLKTFGNFVSRKVIHRLISVTKINSKLFFRGPTIRQNMRLFENKPMKIDKLDKSILKYLALNSREKLVDLSNKVGEEKSKVLYRIKRMKSDGIISAYHITPSLSKINYFCILACISLKNSSCINAIIEFFDKNGICVFAYELFGEYDLALQIYVQNPSELRILMKKFKSQFQPELIDLVTLTVYKDYQLNWTPFC